MTDKPDPTPGEPRETPDQQTTLPETPAAAPPQPTAANPEDAAQAQPAAAHAEGVAHPAAAPPQPDAPRSWRPPRTTRTWVAAVVAGVLLLGGGVGGYFIGAAGDHDRGVPGWHQEGPGEGFRGDGPRGGPRGDGPPGDWQDRRGGPDGPWNGGGR